MSFTNNQRRTWAYFLIFGFAQLSIYVQSANAFGQSDTIVVSDLRFDVTLHEATGFIYSHVTEKANKPSLIKLPLTTDQHVFFSFIIQYNALEKSPIIVSAGGYSFVSAELINLNTGSRLQKKAGRLTPFPENELFEKPTAQNLFRFDFEPSSTYELQIIYDNPAKEKIVINPSIAVENVWEKKRMEKQRSYYYWIGLFFGILILLAIFNVIYYYIFNDKTYQVYAGYIATIVLYQVALSGFLNSSFVKYYPLLLLLVINTSLLLSIIFYLLFLKDFIFLKANYPRWLRYINYAIYYVSIVALGSTLLLLLKQPINAFTFRNLALLPILLFAIIFLVRLVISKRLLDKIFFAGTFFLILSGIISIISYFNQEFTESDRILQIGILTEIVILNIGLGLRSKGIQDEKDQKLIQLIRRLKESEEEQKNMNQQLEQQVDRRTQQISRINQELLMKQEELMVQADQMYRQNEIIAEQLGELNNVKANLERLVEVKTKELKQANRELITQNTQLEQYTYITAHNLRAPVARLKGLINIFELTSNSSDQDKEIIEKIKEASLDMDEVLNDINKILKIKNFNQQDRKEIDLKSLISKIIKRLNDPIMENAIHIETDLKVENIRSLDTYLESILYNLIYNGIKYAQEEVDSFVKISSFERAGQFIICVEDNGIGIDLQKHRKKLFGLYQRFNDNIQGKGIGLYLVKTQVEALNGEITIDSEPGKGTTFQVSLPQ